MVLSSRCIKGFSSPLFSIFPWFVPSDDGLADSLPSAGSALLPFALVLPADAAAPSPLLGWVTHLVSWRPLASMTDGPFPLSLASVRFPIVADVSQRRAHPHSPFCCVCDPAMKVPHPLFSPPFCPSPPTLFVAPPTAGTLCIELAPKTYPF